LAIEAETIADAAVLSLAPWAAQQQLVTILIAAIPPSSYGKHINLHLHLC